MFPVSLPTRAGLERVLLVMYYESLGVARLLARGAHGETGRVIVHYEQLLMEKNMSGYSATMRMERAQKPEVNRCGDCGVEISDSQILCQKCIKNEVDFRGGFQIQSGESQ